MFEDCWEWDGRRTSRRCEDRLWWNELKPDRRDTKLKHSANWNRITHLPSEAADFQILRTQIFEDQSSRQHAILLSGSHFSDKMCDSHFSSTRHIDRSRLRSAGTRVKTVSSGQRRKKSKWWLSYSSKVNITKMWHLCQQDIPRHPCTSRCMHTNKCQYLIPPSPNWQTNYTCRLSLCLLYILGKGSKDWTRMIQSCVCEREIERRGGPARAHQR